MVKLTDIGTVEVLESRMSRDLNKLVLNKKDQCALDHPGINTVWLTPEEEAGLLKLLEERENARLWRVNYSDRYSQEKK